MFFRIPRPLANSQRSVYLVKEPLTLGTSSNADYYENQGLISLSWSGELWCFRFPRALLLHKITRQVVLTVWQFESMKGASPHSRASPIWGICLLLIPGLLLAPSASQILPSPSNSDSILLYTLYRLSLTISSSLQVASNARQLPFFTRQRTIAQWHRIRSPITLKVFQRLLSKPCAPILCHILFRSSRHRCRARLDRPTRKIPKESETANL